MIVVGINEIGIHGEVAKDFPQQHFFFEHVMKPLPWGDSSSDVLRAISSREAREAARASGVRFNKAQLKLLRRLWHQYNVRMQGDYRVSVRLRLCGK